MGYIPKQTTAALFIVFAISMIMITSQPASTLPTPEHQARTVYLAECEFVTNSSLSCGDCDFGIITIKPKGSGVIACWTETRVSDFGIGAGTTLVTGPSDQITHIWLPEDFENLQNGYGYINVLANYDLLNSNNEYTNTYDLWNATLITNYDEWLEMCRYIACSDYKGNKANVFPNPSEKYISVVLDEDYINICGVTSVTYKLYSHDQTLINSSTPNSIDAVVTFNDYLTPGAYFITCIVEKHNTNLNETFSIQFIKQ